MVAVLVLTNVSEQGCSLDPIGGFPLRAGVGLIDVAARSEGGGNGNSRSTGNDFPSQDGVSPLAECLRTEGDGRLNREGKSSSGRAPPTQRNASTILASTYSQVWG
jgi:hypothetical protein